VLAVFLPRLARTASTRAVVAACGFALAEPRRLLLRFEASAK
jgi:hypothetical protein